MGTEVNPAIVRCESMVINMAEAFRDCHGRGDSAAILTHVQRLNAAVDLLREARIRDSRYVAAAGERFAAPIRLEQDQR